MKRLSIALIDESRCIGCTRCIGACPVDAIVGADQLMHTVVVAYCTGCKLCLPACPVDCIEMRRAPADQHWNEGDARAAAARGAARKARIERELARPLPGGAGARALRRSAVAAAIERVRARRASGSGEQS